MSDSLADVPAGRRVIIDAIDGPLRTRLEELGLAVGVPVDVVQTIALGGPVILDRQGFVFAVRRADALAIRVREFAP